MPKSVPKSIQTCFRVIFSKKFYAQCSMEGRVFDNFQFFFQNSKMPKIVPKSLQTCFECVLGQTFRKNFCPVFHGGSSLRKFSKKSLKISNFQKRPKSSPKESKSVLMVFWDNFIEKFLPSVPWRVEFSKIFKKKYFQNSKKAQKCSQKYPNVFLTCFGENFSKNFMPSVPWRVESSKIFRKKYFQNFKIAQKCSQKYPNLL